MIICIGQKPDLVARVSEASGYVVALAPWLPCEEISEPLQG